MSDSFEVKHECSPLATVVDTIPLKYLDGDLLVIRSEDLTQDALEKIREYVNERSAGPCAILGLGPNDSVERLNLGDTDLLVIQSDNLSQDQFSAIRTGLSKLGKMIPMFGIGSGDKIETVPLKKLEAIVALLRANQTESV